jgi:hypothetical protein
MNILYYDERKIKMPDPMEDEEDDNKDNEDHFISIGVDQRYKKGHMIDIYVSLVSDF